MLYTASWPPDMQENLAGQRVPGAKIEGIARVTSALGDEKVLSVHEIWRSSRMLSIGITAWQGRSLIVVFLPISLPEFKLSLNNKQPKFIP